MCYNWHIVAPRRESSPEELAASRDTRIAARRLDQHEQYLALLRQAQRIRLNIHAPDTLADIIASGQSELQGLRALAGGRIAPRRRPHRTSNDPANKCRIFIDECGSHFLAEDSEFGAFVLAAVIVPDIDHPRLDQQWKQWKSNRLGSADKIIHEPNIRRCTGPFYKFKKHSAERTAVFESLREVLTELDFAAIACVVNREEYVAQVGLSSLDSSLPSHPYLMALDFLMERLVMVLDKQFGGAQGHVVAEARGPLEDALLQYEFVRLQLDGTSYISAAWFRQQLEPGIEFKTKKDNCTGLQLADLLARPCGEKVCAPSSTPTHWPEFRTKLCQGQETAHSVLGLKVVPWDECYTDLWKS